jgi:hypothetical protein
LSALGAINALFSNDWTHSAFLSLRPSACTTERASSLRSTHCAVC